MEELYRMIEETIKATGYNGDIDGQDIYEDICDQIEDKEPGSYLLMSKKTDDVFFEYQVDVMEDQFNLSMWIFTRAIRYITLILTD